MAGGNFLRILAVSAQADLARMSLLLSLMTGPNVAASQFKTRRGGWIPNPREGEGGSVHSWRKPYWSNPGWKLLQSPATYDVNSPDGKEFKAVTRLSRARFDYLVGKLDKVDKFKDKPADGRGRPDKVPLALKLLATLACLGSGLSFAWSFRRYCGMDEGHGRKIFHDLVEWLVEHEYEKWVHPPVEENEIRCAEAKFAAMGFPGCITCFDGTHWAWSCAPAGRSFMYTGKEGYPSTVFNVACDSNTRVHHVYGSSPGAVNDKTLARYDDFMVDMHLAGKYSDYTFQVYDPTTKELVERKGLYAIVDGGYHYWRVTQAPVKCASREFDRRYSKRMESVRKCVECLFGRLKRRFLILGKPSMLRSERKLSNVFRVCCMLHNMLLLDDGLHDIGEKPTDWALANTDVDETRIRRALVEQGADFEARAVFAVDDARVGNDTVAETQSSYLLLQHDLIAHFQVAWEKKAIMWPKGAAGCGRKPIDKRPKLPGGLPSAYYRQLVDAGEEDTHWFDGHTWYELGDGAEDEFI